MATKDILDVTIEDGYEYKPLDPHVNCQNCGVRVKIFPAGILVGKNLMEHIQIVKALWHEALTITTSFEFDNDEMLELLESFIETIENMKRLYVRDRKPVHVPWWKRL